MIYTLCADTFCEKHGIDSETLNEKLSLLSKYIVRMALQLHYPAADGQTWFYYGLTHVEGQQKNTRYIYCFSIQKNRSAQ